MIIDDFIIIIILLMTIISSKCPTVNISKRNYWLLMCIAKNDLKDDFLNI